MLVISCELPRWPLGRTDIWTCVLLHNWGSSSTSAKLQIWEKQSWSQYLCFSQQVELQRAKFYMFLTLSPSKIGWKLLLGNCPCPELTPKLSLSITWQRTALPGPKHTKHEIGLQLVVSEMRRKVQLFEPLISRCPWSLSCSWIYSSCIKFRGIKVKTSSFPLAVFLKPNSEQVQEWHQWQWLGVTLRPLFKLKWWDGNSGLGQIFSPGVFFNLYHSTAEGF